MKHNCLKLNTDKTKKILTGSKVSPSPLKTSAWTLTPSLICNLDILFIQNIHQITQIAFFHLRNMAQVHLSHPELKNGISSCMIHYRKALNKLQYIQNQHTQPLSLRSFEVLCSSPVERSSKPGETEPSSSPAQTSRTHRPIRSTVQSPHLQEQTQKWLHLLFLCFYV